MKTYIGQNLFKNLLGLGLMAIAANISQAQTQTSKLVADDYAAEDSFGSVVSISGDLGLVTAPGDDNGDASGSAYVFDVNTGQQLIKLLPDDQADFGSAAAIDGNCAVITSEAYNNGAAYVFDVTTGQQSFKLSPADGPVEKSFGESVALSGNIVVVGAPNDNVNGDASGSAYLFDVTTGQQTLKLLPQDGAPIDRFGGAVSISGNFVIAGAEGNDMGAGAAYIFDATTGQQLFKLVANDRAPARLFGGAVAIYGTTAVIGSTLDDENGSRSGAAYAFDVTTGQQMFKLTAADAAPVDFFGWAVALSGNIALIGAPIRDGETGSAYLFDVTTGQQLAKVLAGDGASGDSFGGSVAISGNTALSGASGDSLGSGSDTVIAAGSAYVFRINQSPIADASATELFWTSPNGVDANVVLDGSLSFDPDGDPLTHLWLTGSTPIGTDMVQEGTFAVGVHAVDLVVDDGMAQDTDTITVTVLTADQSVERLALLVVESHLARVRSLMSTLNAALAALSRGSSSRAVKQLHVFQNNVRARVAPNDPDLAAELNYIAAQIIDALGVDSPLRGGARRRSLKRSHNTDVRLEIERASRLTSRRQP